jgi:CheY-like chemotaxis protein
LSRAKILIIEDSLSDVFLLRKALTDAREDFELEVVPDGEKALQFIHRQRKNMHESVPCVIVLDLHLPKHDGLEILEALRECPALSHIHVVVTTNMASPQETAELRRMGLEYRPKPSKLSEFQRLAADLIALCSGSAMAA